MLLNKLNKQNQISLLSENFHKFLKFLYESTKILYTSDWVRTSLDIKIHAKIMMFLKEEFIISSIDVSYGVPIRFGKHVCNRISMLIRKHK